MAYKDEYEVARLLLDDQARAGYEAVGGRGTTVTYHLHPPMLRAMGINRKLKLRRSAVPTLRALRAAKGLRGTLVDPFRWAEVRRVERAMIPEYIELRARRGSPSHARRSHPRRGRRDRLAPRSGSRLRGPQAAPGRRLPRRARPAHDLTPAAGVSRGLEAGADECGADDAGVVRHRRRHDLGVDRDDGQPLRRRPSTLPRRR